MAVLREILTHPPSISDGILYILMGYKTFDTPGTSRNTTCCSLYSNALPNGQLNGFQVDYKYRASTKQAPLLRHHASKVTGIRTKDAGLSSKEQRHQLNSKCTTRT